MGLRLSCVLVLASILHAQGVKDFEKQVTEFTLPNGLHFLVVERHDAPVVSFHTLVRAGSVDDPAGQTGLAFLIGRLALKGSETIGTRDWESEKKALDAVEEAYDRMEAERNKGVLADQAKLSLLEAQASMAGDRAQAFVQRDDYAGILVENGAAEFKTGASPDATVYAYSLPSNHLELWFLMESQRLFHPVFREFYQARSALLDELRAGQRDGGSVLVGNFLAAAFAAHPYRQPVAGWPGDTENLRRSSALRFAEKYYVPGNISIAIAGDVNPADIRRLADRYFAPVPARPLPPAVHTVEPPQTGPRLVFSESASRPVAVFGFRRPAETAPDDPVLDVLAFLLSSGSTGMLQKELVAGKRVAESAVAAATYPAGKYPCVFAFFIVPSAGHTTDENEKALGELLARLIAQPVEEAGLARAKAQARAAAMRLITGNAGLASILNTFYVGYGDWRQLFTALDRYNQVTAADIQRVALRYFVAAGETKAYSFNRDAAPSTEPHQ